MQRIASFNLTYFSSIAGKLAVCMGINLNIEEKLKHFEEASIESAKARSIEIIQEYTAALETIFKEHKEQKTRQAQIQLKLECDNMKLENNKRLSQEQISIKRDLSVKTTELKDKIFVEVGDMLEHYMTTKEYQELLVKYIKKALEFAQDQEMIIYIDPSDAGKKVALTQATGADLTISQYSFSGGIRAIITEKHILMDYSFATRLTEAKEQFSLKLEEAKESFKTKGGSIHG